MPGPVHMLYPHRSAPSPSPARAVARRGGYPSSASATNRLTMLLAATALFLLAGCSAAHGAVVPAQHKDIWGNVIPVECRGDLPAIPVIEVSADWLVKATGGAKDRLGLWSPVHVAYVLKGLDAATRAEVVRHEQCHEQMWRVTGDASWHGGN
jgi:hypothetical protein